MTSPTLRCRACKTERTADRRTGYTALVAFCYFCNVFTLHDKV